MYSKYCSIWIKEGILTIVTETCFLVSTGFSYRFYKDVTKILAGSMMAIILILIDVFLMCTSSMYGAAELVRAKQKNKVSGKLMIANIVMHFIFK